MNLKDLVLEILGSFQLRYALANLNRNLSSSDFPTENFPTTRIPVEILLYFIIHKRLISITPTVSSYFASIL